VTDWLAKIDVMVMPVSHGGGTRVKVLEALCHRVPVVAHPYAVAGLDVADGEHALLADTPAGMAEHTALLLRDSETRLALVDAGRALFEASYTWESSRRIAVEAVSALLKR
jgi:glycosyltransferase involved in cell wall biosynthesis